MQKSTLAAALGLLLAVSSPVSHAYSFVVSSQTLMGIDDLVTTSGHHYDVSFGDGSPSTLWPSNQFDFSTPTEAGLANTALRSALLASGFTSANLPNGINGIATTYTQTISIIFPVLDLGGGFFSIPGLLISSANIGNPFPNFFIIAQSTFLNNYSAAGNTTWAKFTEVAAVPEPASAWLMIAGATGLWSRKARPPRRKSAAA